MKLTNELQSKLLNGKRNGCTRYNGNNGGGSYGYRCRGNGDASLYQFEGRYFQFSCLTGNCLFIRCWNHASKYNREMKRNYQQYMVFKFGNTCCKRNGSIETFYGFCEENDRKPKQQHWHCKYVFTIDQLITFMRSKLRHHKATYQSQYMLKNNRNSNSSSESSCTQQRSDSFGLHAKEVNAMGSRVCHAESTGVLHMTQDHSKNGVLKKCLLKMQSNGNCVRKQFRPNIGFNAKVQPILRRLRLGLENKLKNKYRHKLHVKCDSMNRFDYLHYLTIDLNISKDYLLDKVGESIVASFKFAIKHPETALTQVYIDESQSKLSYDLILAAELKFEIKTKPKQCKYYKFGVTVDLHDQQRTQGQQRTENTRVFYFAQNIVTPTTAATNIRLNSPNCMLDKNTWVASPFIYDSNVSFYKYIDPQWYNCNNMSQMSLKHS